MGAIKPTSLSATTRKTTRRVSRFQAFLHVLFQIGQLLGKQFRVAEGSSLHDGPLDDRTTYRANSLVLVRRVTRPCRAAVSRWGRNSRAISSKHSARTEERGQEPFDIEKGSGAFCGTPLVIRYSQDMPRPRRAAESGLIYRALNRANARLAIFQTDEDYAAFQASWRSRQCASHSAAGLLPDAQPLPRPALAPVRMATSTGS